MGLTRTAITRPIFMLMLILATLLMGTIAYKSMRLELNPDVTFPTITVSTVYPGADPDTINTLVSRKIEDAVSGVSNLREITSTSQEGVSVVVANFELGTEINVALDDIRTRVDGAVSQLPREVEKPTVSKFDFSAQPVLYLAFNSKTRTSQELRDLLDNKLQDRFAQISGVAQAAVQGGDEREIQIQLDRNKLLAYKIGIADVARQISAATQNVPGGRVISKDTEYSVRVKGDWQTVDDVRATILNLSDPKDPMARTRSVKLTEIATVADTVKERQNYARLNGNDTVILVIQKAREGNAVEITKSADTLIQQLKTEYPDLEIVKTVEQAKQISESLEDLNFTLFFAIFLVSAVVYVFLHNFRGTLIVAIAIPICVFASFIAMWLAGFTINNLSMLALILAVGVLVDDAIVVLENIYRHLKMGEDPREAALNGRGEIGTAALAITAADVVVFLPIAFMGGIVGQFFKPLALAYVFAVLSSLFVSFTITPMLAARWYKAGEDMEHPTGRFSIWFERQFGKFEGFYRRVLEWSLNHRWFVFILGNSSLVAIFMFIGGAFTGLGAKSYGDAIASGSKVGMMLVGVAIVIGVVTAIVNSIRKSSFQPKYVLYGLLFGLLFPSASSLGAVFGYWKQSAPFTFAFLPGQDSNGILVNVELPPGTSLSRTQETVERIEKIVGKHPAIKYVLSTLGSQGASAFSGGGNQGSNYAQVQGSLYDKGAFLDKMPWKHHEEKLRWESDTAVAADITERIGRIAGADVKVSTNNSSGFGSPIQMSFRSTDRQLLFEATSKIKNRLLDGAVKGVINADVSTVAGKPEIQARPDRQRIADNGMSVADVASATRTLYNGDDTTKFRADGIEYSARVLLAPKDKNNPDIVSTVPLTFKQGEPVYLGDVTTLVESPSLDKIQRRDRAEEVQVTADLLPGFQPGTVQGQIDKLLKDQKLIPDGVEYKPLGQADAQQRETGFLLSAFALGLILVYMLLASLYDNLLYPFIIQLSQPQAITGALLALVLTDKPFSLIGFIGLVTLIGLVGKNAILLVDYTNTLRDRGRSRHDALVEAGPTRLRPIIMTTLALIVGTLPIALAIGRGSEFRETIGIVIIGGMLLSTLLTLVVIPCSYTIFDDISNSFSKLRGKPGQHEAVNESSEVTPTGTPV